MAYNLMLNPVTGRLIKGMYFAMKGESLYEGCEGENMTIKEDKEARKCLQLSMRIKVICQTIDGNWSILQSTESNSSCDASNDGV